MSNFILINFRRILAILVFFILSTGSVSAANNISLQYGVVYHYSMSYLTCVNYAQQICDGIIGNCTHSKAGAIGGPRHTKIALQCGTMSNSRAMLMVLHGATTKDSSKEFSRLLSKLYYRAKQIFDRY